MEAAMDVEEASRSAREAERWYALEQKKQLKGYILGVLMNEIVMPKWSCYMPWFFGSGVLMTIGSALMYTT